ncbi:tyrosine-protein phosphatase [Microbacterium horticulturae]|uniref:Tyrosine-protein phosphatase n=1 Tax=Microbacterium horticulturae TaxID=3028316 RepID=A0ABY8BWR7_9MICO|nr:tyrosine-protein phosphatase [Microbacterium sp. KACC 23027]WEG08601.1 tyrosine-protein phosphatase [Microbacterium sp. KACC 23027]
MTSLFAGTYNSRDTGGMPLPGGGQTRAGVLYRSDALSGITDAGLAELDASPIGAVVDFRTGAERSAAPDRLPERRLDTEHLSVLEGAAPGIGAPADMSTEAVRAVLEQIPTLGDLYIRMLDGAAASFARVARLVAAPTDEGKPGVLVHCTAGKDRTGVATALLLDAVGAERDAIVADYAVSEQNLSGEWAERMLQGVAKTGVPMLPQIVALVTATPPDAMRAMLAWVDDQGGSAAYLRTGGLSDDEFGMLRARLVE